MGIAVSSDGSRIYAAQSEPTAAVVVFDAHGQQVAQMDPPDPTSYHVFVYVALNPLTGEIYVSDRPAGAIYVYGADGSYERTFDPPSPLAGWSPLGLNFDAAGNLFVTDAAVGRVYEFGPDGSLVRSIGANNQFSFPNSALDDSAARLYIADSNNGRLAVLGNDGSQLAVVRRGPGDGDLGMPRGIALDNQSRLFVVDATSQAVKVYRVAADASGQPTFVGQFGTQGVGDGQFNFPNAVATDSRGRVYVADWANDRIQVWSY
jgi:tripartite motif-containing protein 71